MSFLKSSSWCLRRYIYKQNQILYPYFKKHLSQTCTERWNSKDIRRKFIEYFKSRDHLYVHSSSVVPRQGEGTYFVNAGMNQFKPVFLGTVDTDNEMGHYCRVVNSQKCIRVGGKHNDLDDVGSDTYHHTFFEMLGSWSFGDYFKRQACEYAWQLLTKVYKLPEDRLYVTYFGGDPQLGLQADLECKEIWLDLGVAPERVLPCGSRDNFWDMGLTGPCGPCTEIHYDHLGTDPAPHLVNAGSPSVIELWNLVFMQYDRQADGSLLPLPAQHVDTGMGLERLTAVLQGTMSNYNTDLFRPLFDSIHQYGQCPHYENTTEDSISTDRAYRIVADHLRMVTIAVADGVRPGRKGIDSKLRLVLDRCIHQATQVLGLSPGHLARLVPVVVDILGEAFPELEGKVAQVQDVIGASEERYLSLFPVARKLVLEAVSETGNGSKIIAGGDLWRLQEKTAAYRSLPPDMVLSIAREMASLHGYQLENLHSDDFHKDKDEDVQVLELKGDDDLHLTQHDVRYLRAEKLTPTDDHFKYDLTKGQAASSLAAIKLGRNFVEAVLTEGQLCGLITQETPFYAEAGGQISDKGTWENQACCFEVTDIQSTQGYVVHVGTVIRGSLKVGDTLIPTVDKASRQGCSCNHTATHLINHALETVLGQVYQQGSSVSPHKLVFDFTCAKTHMDLSDLEKVTEMVNDMIRKELPVDTAEVNQTQAKAIQGIKTLAGEVYPSTVRVVSVGLPVSELLRPSSDAGLAHSVELCGGTHVKDTGEIGHLAITHLSGMQQGTKRLVAVTGPAAIQIQENSALLGKDLLRLESQVKCGLEPQTWTAKLHNIDQRMTGADALPLSKLDRDNFLRRLENLKQHGLSAAKNSTQLSRISEEVGELLNKSADSSYVVEVFPRNCQIKQMAQALLTLAPTKPVMILLPSHAHTRAAKNTEDKQILAVTFVPPQCQNEVSSQAWSRQLFLGLSNTQGLVDKFVKTKGSPSKTSLYAVSLFITQQRPMEHYIKLARDHMETR